MHGTYTKLYFHIVFSTKTRKPYIRQELEPQLHKYIAGTLRELGGSCIEINGTVDHIHILALMTPKLALSDVLRDVRANSSKWIHEKFPQLAMFAWQDGFSAFTISTSQVPDVRAYIQNQKEHHKRSDFKAELLALLERHGVYLGLSAAMSPLRGSYLRATIVRGLTPTAKSCRRFAACDSSLRLLNLKGAIHIPTFPCTFGSRSTSRGFSPLR